MKTNKQELLFVLGIFIGCLLFVGCLISVTITIKETNDYFRENLPADCFLVCATNYCCEEIKIDINSSFDGENCYNLLE